jgi:LacI family transcriptional regulator
MNGAPNVSETTRALVLEASRKLDYLPNPAARALSTSKSMTIAAIIPTIEHSIYAKYIAAIERTLAESGYSLVLAVSNADDESELKAARKLLGMGAQAFILSGAAHSPELADLFKRRGLPFVFTSVWDMNSQVPTIGYDNAALARRAVTYLSDRGHRDIAVLHGPVSESDRTKARREGAKQADDGSLNLGFFETSLDVAGGRQAVEAMLATGQKATAFLCFSDVLALGAYFELQNAGLSVPGDMSVMGFDNLDWSAAVLPGLTTIDLPAVAMGENVASQLINHLEKGKPISPTNLEAKIVERGSVSPIAF